jgi:hypothetical protein
VWALHSDAAPEGVQRARVQSGGFDATLGPIGAGKPTVLYYFVDVDSNGFCSGEPAGSQSELEFDLAGGRRSCIEALVNDPGRRLGQ